jgi:hypothetical protein
VSTQVVLIIAGVVLVVVAVIGGPVNVLKVEISKLSTWARLSLFVIGIAAFVLGLFPGVYTASPTARQTTSSTSTAAYHINIASPISVITCTTSAPQCQFELTGQVTADLPADLEVVVLVYPIHPGAGGWFIQWPPASIQATGSWSQSPAYIGAGVAPARDGDTLQVEAVLVNADATYNGTALSDLSKSGTSIPDVSQITGLVKRSDPVQLTVKKP